MAQQIVALPQITVTTAGTRVQVSAIDTRTHAVTIQAATANTGNIYVGDSTVSATKAVMELAPGTSVRVSGQILRNAQDELSLFDLWLDSATSGNKANVGYIKNRN